MLDRDATQKKGAGDRGAAGVAPCLAALAIVGGSMLASPRSNAVAAEPKRPNIILIFSDDHAYQAISSYGFGLNQTPNIDRLSTSGMRFTRCLTTNSLCGPSRATVLTGKYSHLNGFYHNTCTSNSISSART